jgi:tetratricopeptide (TPR) repeat protein
MIVLILAANQVYSNEIDNWVSLGDMHWESRDRLESIEKAIECYKKAIELNPGDPGLLERLSYACFFQGWELKEFRGNEYRKKREALFTSGMRYAEEALAISAENTMAKFRYIMNKLMYRREFSIISSAKMVPELRDCLASIMEKEKFLESGGPQRVMANLIMEVPGFLHSSFSLGDLEEAEKMLKEAISFDSRFILNYVTLADVYMKQKKKKEAKEQLQIAIDYPIDPEYTYATENRRDKKAAMLKMKEYFGR